MLKKFKKFRKDLRNRIQHASLLKENHFYTKIFKERGLIIPDEKEVKKNLKEKFPHLVPQRMGSLEILAIYHHYNWENTSLLPALKLFGNVHHFDWHNRLEASSRHARKCLRIDMNRDLLEWIDKHNKTKPVDFIFFYISGEQILPSTLAEVKKLKVPLVNLSLNDKESFVGRVEHNYASGVKDICQYFDLNWTSTSDAIPKYLVEGALPIYLPEGANPNIHKPHKVPFDFDVSFVGQKYGNRPEVIEYLRSSGVRVEAFGYGWPNGPLSTEEMVKMYSRTRINLGFSSVPFKDIYHLKGRDFEVPMSGGLYLTEFHPELSTFFEIEEEIATYKTKKELVQKIQYLLNCPEQAEKIRKQGYNRAKNHHCWEMRFEKIFSLFGLIKNPPTPS